MNKITLFLIAFFIGAKSYATETNKVAPSFYITNTSVLKTLKQTEAQFAFTFYVLGDTGTNSVPASVKMSYNDKELTIKPDKNGKYILALTPGKYKFKFFYTSDYLEVYSYEVKILAKNKIDAQVYFQKSRYEVIADKPVIYCYPTKEQKVEVKLKPLGEMKFTYPIYKNSWSFTAQPNGELIFGDKTYNYLFWEAALKIEASSVDLSSGYQVQKDSLLSFFEQKLSAMNLSSKEIQDYVTYWIPQMSKSKQYYVHFLFNESFDKYASLEITPKPENLFRVFMVMKPLESDTNLHLKPQIIQKVNRTGFTVVEWGGTELSSTVLIEQL